MRVVYEVPVGGAHVLEQVLDALADQFVSDGPDRLGRDVVAAPGREDEADADKAVAGVGGEAEVGRGVVRIGFIASEPSSFCEVGNLTSTVWAAVMVGTGFLSSSGKMTEANQMSSSSIDQKPP